MNLSPQWKIHVINSLVEMLFISYGRKQFNQDIHDYIQSKYFTWGPITCILYKDQYYFPYEMRVKSNTLIMHDGHPDFPEFNEILTKWDDYSNLCKVAKNYLSNAFAIAKQRKDLEELFPDFILGKINAITSNLPDHVNLYSRPPGCTKFLRFVERYDNVVTDLKKKAAYNIIMGSKYE